jgi:hypothetical protein
MTRLMAYARIAEKTGQHTLAFDHYRQANEIEKARILANPKIAFDSSAKTALTASFIDEFPSAPTNAATVTDDACPIFIVGMPRTCTTLLERILWGLKGVKPQVRMPHLAKLCHKVNGIINIVMHRQLWLELHKIGKICAAIFWPCRILKKGRFLTKKRPYNFRHIDYILTMLSDAPIIHIRRDPRDVYWSIYTRFFSGGHHYSADLQWILQEYELSERLINHFKVIAPDNMLTVDYEALVYQPLVNGIRITDFCGLSWEPTCLDFHKRTAASYTSSELQVRKALNSNGIGRWRRYEAQLGDFDSS